MKTTAKLTQSEGPYEAGSRVTASPRVRGATYVDPARFRAWLKAGILETGGKRKVRASRKGGSS